MFTRLTVALTGDAVRSGPTDKIINDVNYL